MMAEGALALRTLFRHTSRAAKAGVEVVALRRPELVLRRTRYDRVIVDERLLTRAFAWVERPSRLQAIALLEGQLRVDTRSGALDLGPGDVLFLTPSMARHARFDRAFFVDLEWTTDQADPLEGPRVVGKADRAALAHLAGTLADDARPHRALYAEAFSVLASAGVPLGSLSAASIQGGPTAREERVARALEAQFRDLSTVASSLQLGELADLSPRQLQRVLEDLTTRYGLNGGNWRDMRNRWRIQIAAVLLSVPELTVADVAEDVGYATASALARAFANAGLPSPTALRDALGIQDGREK